jgi:hypothetical protein
MDKMIEERVDAMHKKRALLSKKINEFQVFMRNNPDKVDIVMEQAVKDMEERLAKIDEMILKIDRLCKPS